MQTCVYCGRATNKAPENGWIPSFYHEGKEHFLAVCPECAARFLQFNKEFGDYETKSGSSFPEVTRN